MKRLWLTVIVLVLAGIPLVAQEMWVSGITDWSKGLVTNKGTVGRQFDEPTIYHNLDLTLNPPYATPRLGYSSIVTMPNVDSFLWGGLFTMKYRDGRKQLMLTAKWTDSAWAGIFASVTDGFGFGAIDSFYVEPDTAATIALAEAAEKTDNQYYLRILSAGDQWAWAWCFDTTTTREEIVDSFVKYIPLAGCSLYVDITDNDTSFTVTQAQINFDVTLTLQCDPFDECFLPCGQWDTAFASYDAVNTDVLSRFPATGTVKMAQHNDKAYIINGVAKGAVYNGRTCVDFPVRTPGEPSILPLTTTGTLSGTYRYAFRYTERTDSAGVPDSILLQDLSCLSTPVRVTAGQVLLWNWPIPTRDTLRGDDSVGIEMYRSAGDIGIVDDSDSLWLLDVIVCKEIDSFTVLEYTDTISDSTLRTRAGLPILDDRERLFRPNEDTLGSDTGVYEYWQSPGAPGIISYDSVPNDSDGIWTGGAEQWEDVAGWSWMTVAVDTANNIVSDSGRSINMYQAYEADEKFSPWSTLPTYSQDWEDPVDTFDTGFARDDVEQFRIVLPRIPGRDDVVMRLYRGPIVAVGFDSIGWNKIQQPDGNYEIGYKNFRNWQVRGLEFEVSSYYLIGEFNPGDTLLDSIHYDSLQLRDHYRRNTVPALPTGVIAAGNRLIMSDNNTLYMSELIDSTTRFSVLQQKPVNPDDGSQIVTIWEQAQGVIKVAKTSSTYQMYRSGGVWIVPERARSYGCVAPLSVAQAPEGDYFLSSDGRVRREVESSDRALYFDPKLASGQLSNFAGLSVTELRDAFAVYHDNKYILTVPALDTSYVCNKVIDSDNNITYGWSTWSLSMVGATKFRNVSENLIVPGDTLYFIQSGSATLYKYGTGRLDDGDEIRWHIRTGPTNAVDGDMRVIERIDYYINSDDSNSLPIAYRAYGDWGGTEAPAAQSLPRLDTTNYHQFDHPSADGSLYWTLEIVGAAFQAPSGVTILEGLWIRTSRAEEYGPK